MSQSAQPSKFTRRFQPCHPLAQYVIAQIDTLEYRAQYIVKTMGYPLKHTMPACERLRHVLSNKHLGLDGSYMDKYFSAEEFLAKLFSVLDLPYEPFAEDISSTEEMIDIAIADAGLAFSNIGLITVEKWDSLDIYEKAGFIFAHMYQI